MIDSQISDALNKSMLKQDYERSYIDKLLAKEDIASVRNILKKTVLNREDMLEVNDYIVSMESKLLNLSERERYVLNKYYVWINYMMGIFEVLFDYGDNLAKIKTPELDKNVKYKQIIEQLDMAKKNTSNMLKMMFNVYLLIARTSLSAKGKTIGDFSSNKFDINYGGSPFNQPTQDNNNKIYGGGSK